MAVLPILIYGDERLKKEAGAVEKIDDEIRGIIQSMIETLIASKGVGLAATQVGILKQMIVIDGRKESGKMLVYLNPVIVCASGSDVAEERCLSLPGIEAEVKRALDVEVTATGENEEILTMKITGLMARIFQHEIDHLKGVLFVDRLSPIRRALLRTKLKKLKGKK